MLSGGSLAPFRLEADLASAVHPIPEAPRDLEGRLDDPRGTAVVLTALGHEDNFPVGWESPLAKAVREAAAAVSHRLGHHG